jgi:hypothetical protein
MHELNCDAINQSEKHTKQMTGILLSAAIDPGSVINRGHRAIIEEKIKSL